MLMTHQDLAHDPQSARTVSSQAWVCSLLSTTSCAFRSVVAAASRRRMWLYRHIADRKHRASRQGSPRPPLPMHQSYSAWMSGRRTVVSSTRVGRRMLCYVMLAICGT
jgi:hypothetical protein